MKVLIAGCGDLGTEAGLRFAAAGHQVLGLRRSPGKLPDVIEGLGADLGAPLPDLPSDVEVMVYSAAADGRSEHAYRRAYVDGPRHVLDALDRAGARVARVLFVSSTGVYGITDGSEVDEDTPTEPTSASGAVLVEAERALQDRRPDATVFRLAGVYGPGRTRLIDQVRDGSAVIPDPPVHTNRIHRDDAAQAIVELTTASEPPPRVLIGVDHDPAERGEVLRFLADELGLPHPPTGPDGRGRGGDKRCRNDRLVATGFRFTYPTFREGYRAVLAGVGVRHP
jgi:nucleoside-diphosphate-sugar epimerase